MENLKDVRECLVLFGGCKKGNKVDKSTGIKTAEEYFQFQIFEVDEDTNMVNSKMFYTTEEMYEKIVDLDLKLLHPCYVYIKSSATSNFVKLVDVKKYVEEKKQVNNNIVK